ncbi:protein phosphatase 1 regulatory subunit 1C-like [Scleropages formosus]|uniref:protein phosphatase 1 regulatory subunit 1C-like n=1 Tax=Scleropages formosus TaxID=113540 RepID=UPI00087856FC|nr:protein phosphatase 1 regulatory subunit 1C-like [Scleropages formosus]
MEPNSPKKIQFSVLPLQKQLDPQAAEHIRRRRPTPATLALHTDPRSTEVGAQQRTGNPGQAQVGELSSAQRKQGVYRLPAMKGGKLLKTHKEPPFLEEEEAVIEQEARDT